ncbi:Putative exported protein [Enterobacteriaceae bacterium bta3-1]|nr:Putative exported protein [Enterobacteriaceae bacterium bta3-1]
MLLPFNRCSKLRATLFLPSSILARYAFIGLSLLTPLAHAATPTAAFTEAQQEEIGQIAAMYLAQHPEYLTAAQETLRQNLVTAQSQKIASAVSENANLLLTDSSPSLGAKDSAVAMVVFSDYLSSDSQKLDAIIENFRKQHSDVRVIYKEFPITTGRWPVSGEAAMAAQQVWHESGAKTFNAVRKSLFAIPHGEVKLTEADIANVLQKAHIPELKPGKEILALRAEINANLKLGQDMGMTTAPVVIVMPQKSISGDQVSVFNRVPSNEQLVQAVKIADVKR